jgi:D-xylose transport system ATP-binding protein
MEKYPPVESRVLEVQHLVKCFGPTTALTDVNFKLGSGHVVALAGGNGSGKSTLLRIMAGALTPDSGVVFVNGTPLAQGVNSARSAGIDMVFQNDALCPDASILDNMFLGSEPTVWPGLVRITTMRARAARVIDEYRLPIKDIQAVTRTLSGGQRKAVAIARALLGSPRFLLLDEPTASLGVKQQEIVLNTISDLRTRGVGIMICTHSADEILAVASRVLILRHGHLVEDRPTEGMSRAALVTLMST